MADATDPHLAAELKKKRTFRTFSYRGIELEKLLDLGNEEVSTFIVTLALILTDPTLFAACRCVYRFAPPISPLINPDWCALQVVHARARRRFNRGLKRKPLGLIKKLRKAKKEAPPNEKPAVVKTHLRNMIIVPEMIGSVVGIYNGKVRTGSDLLDFRYPSSMRLNRFSTRLKSNPR